MNNAIESQTDSIFATIKAPMKSYLVLISDNILIQEQTQLKGSELEIMLNRESCVPSPVCANVNLNLIFVQMALSKVECYFWRIQNL